MVVGHERPVINQAVEQGVDQIECAATVATRAGGQMF